MNTTTAKPTAGPYELGGPGVQLRSPDRGIAEFWITGEEKANAELTLQAFAVYHETGFTPRQLADQRAELIAAIEASRSLRTDLSLGNPMSCYTASGIADWILRRAKAVPK